MTYTTTSYCEVDDCREPAYCLVGIGLSGSMHVCKRHGESAERMGFSTGFNNLTAHSDLRSHEPPRNSGEGTAVNGPMPLAGGDDAHEPT